MNSDTPTSILMTTDTIGGVWTYAIDLSRELNQRGIALTLAAMGAPASPTQRRQARRAGVNLHESDYRLEWMDDPWADVDAAGPWLLQLADDCDADLVHLNGYAHGQLPWRRPTVMVAHSCVFSWWHAVHGCAPPASWREYQQRVRQGLLAADLVTAPTQAMLDQLARWYAPLPNTRAIHNGRACGRLAPANQQHMILCAGRLWDQAKNCAALARIAKQLDWPVVLAGEQRGPDGRTCDLEHVQCLGHLASDDLADWMSRAAIYALPARYEPFGLSALEAARCGCALVLSDIATLREVWQDAAEYVPLDDDDALRDAINRLARDHTRRTTLARRAMRRASQLGPAPMADGYVDGYRQVMNRHRSARQFQESH